MLVFVATLESGSIEELQFRGHPMRALNPALLRHLASGPDIPLDDWLNLVSIMRERRNRILGADLFHDPAMAILLALGRDAHGGGLPLVALVSATGVSLDVARRLALILIERGFVEVLQGKHFKLTTDGRARLQQSYS